jgi:hypothetical protein
VAQGLPIGYLRCFRLGDWGTLESFQSSRGLVDRSLSRRRGQSGTDSSKFKGQVCQVSSIYEVVECLMVGILL